MLNFCLYYYHDLIVQLWHQFGNNFLIWKKLASFDILSNPNIYHKLIDLIVYYYLFFVHLSFQEYLSAQKLK